jgi:hypothetical protein
MMFSGPVSVVAGLGSPKKKNQIFKLLNRRNDLTKKINNNNNLRMEGVLTIT